MYNIFLATIVLEYETHIDSRKLPIFLRVFLFNTKTIFVEKLWRTKTGSFSMKISSNNISILFSIFGLKIKKCKYLCVRKKSSFRLTCFCLEYKCLKNLGPQSPLLPISLMLNQKKKKKKKREVYINVRGNSNWKIHEIINFI